MASSIRHYSFIEKLLIEAQHAIETQTQTKKISDEKTYHDLPALITNQDAVRLTEILTAQELSHTKGCMRINHTGEICAQALYRGQAFFAENDKLKPMLLNAAKEEEAHLNWCYTRLNQLNTKRSIFNPLWYAGSFLIGLIAGKQGEKISLGFIVETEKQVGIHIKEHLQTLSKQDHTTRIILEKMKEDEQVHAMQALQAGGKNLSYSTKKIMYFMASIMKAIVYRL